MDPLSFEAARALIVAKLRARRPAAATETVALLDAGGRVLAQDVRADRDYPPLDRVVRDGFAIRAIDAPGEFDVIGEVRAGEIFRGAVGPRQTVEVMTGAPLPAGADAVVMVEHVERDAERIHVGQNVAAGLNYNPRGSEVREGGGILAAGTRIGYAEIAALAMTGAGRPLVFARPAVAILATGDELVPVDAVPEPWQIRDTNLWSLAEQVRKAGGVPRLLPTAPDELTATCALVGRGLECDLLLLSGGVSAGKYDLVEAALRSFEAEFLFDRVLIQPGQPLVFGAARGKFFFGLPGNPASAMVCFEVFARPALELLCGVADVDLRFVEAELATEFHHRPGLTRFLPALLSADGRAVTPVRWAGSGDIAALCRANAYLVAESERPDYAAGERIRVLPR